MTETTTGSHLETDHQLLSGCREDVLRRVNGAWKVSRRAIMLNANQDGVVRWAKAIWDAGISRMGCHRACAAEGKGTVGSGAPLAFCEP